MAGYSEKWQCRICTVDQDSMSVPAARVCEECLHGLASMLCGEELKVPLSTAGVDQGYWILRAHKFASALMRDWCPRGETREA